MDNTNLKYFLSKKDLSMEEFFILNLLYTDTNFYLFYVDKNKYKLNLEKIFQTFLINGYISIIDKDKNLTELSNIVLVKEYSSVFNFDIESELEIEEPKVYTKTFEEQWDEFISLYPKKVNNRPLHNLKDKAKAKYLQIIKNINHDDIIKALKLEISLREKSKIRKEFFPEWKLLSTYINQKGWEPFLELDENENYSVNSDGRITKVLG